MVFGLSLVSVEPQLLAHEPAQRQKSNLFESARCNPRYRDFIDFIILDRRAVSDLRGFEEKTFEGEGLSDHCAVSARLSLRS
jgi:hypothetical protein